MKKTIITVIVALIATVIMTSGTVHATVSGITKDNYPKYLEGEEYFYNEYYDHWNVEKVYDRNLIPKTTNKGLVKAYCKKHYKTRAIKYTNYKPYRKSAKYVYVETVKSVSDGGRHGHTSDGYYIKYNAKVKKGTKVTSYLIYNPKTKYIDDVVAVVDNKKIR